MNEILLMLPGPTTADPRVLQAMGKAVVNHRGDEFGEIYTETTQLMSKTFQTKNDSYILTGSGTSAMEAALSNLVKEKLINVCTDTDGVTMYSISDDGATILTTLLPTLSDAVRGTYDTYLAKEKSKIAMETNINAYPFIDNNQNQCIRCYIREKGNKIVDIRIPVPDRETALQMCSNWKTMLSSLPSSAVM